MNKKESRVRSFIYLLGSSSEEPKEVGLENTLLRPIDLFINIIEAQGPIHYQPLPWQRKKPLQHAATSILVFLGEGKLIIHLCLSLLWKVKFSFENGVVSCFHFFA